MGRKICLFLAFALLNNKIFSQEINRFSAGINFSVPVTVSFETNKATGYGVEVQWEHFLSSKLSMNLKIGYTHFNGSITYWDGTKDKFFALIPASAGGKYYINNFYFGAGGGLAVKASNNTATNLMLFPTVGIVKKSFDLSVVYMGILQTFNGTPESTFLVTGGYSYFGLHFNYLLFK